MSTKVDQTILVEAPPPDVPPPEAPSVVVKPVTADSMPAGKSTIKPSPDSIRVEMMPVAKFDPATFELVDVDATQGIQAVIGNLNKWADGDAKVVCTYVFTGDAWADQSASKYVKAKGVKKGEPWDAKPEADAPPESDQPAERHYNQPRKHAHTLAELKLLRKQVKTLLAAVADIKIGEAPIVPGEQPEPEEGGEGGEPDKVKALQGLWDEFVASAAELLGLQPPEGAAQKEPQNSGGMGLSAEKFSESFTGLHAQLEEKLSEADPPTKPLSMLVELIQPGWGNPHDNHYYPAEMLKNCGERFVGKKMYETDHRDDEKSTRTWVSTVKEMVGISATGAPLARVVVHNPDFAERVRNLQAGGLLDKMECSILADGTATPGYTEGGRTGKRVDSITEVESVDWVTRAGAGGHVAELSESAKSVPIDETEARALIEASGLPTATRVRLNEKKLAEKGLLLAEIDAERAYLQQVTGSGQPFGNGGSAPKPQLSEADRTAALDALIERTFGK